MKKYVTALAVASAFTFVASLPASAGGCNRHPGDYLGADGKCHLGPAPAGSTGAGVSVTVSSGGQTTRWRWNKLHQTNEYRCTPDGQPSDHMEPGPGYGWCVAN